MEFIRNPRRFCYFVVGLYGLTLVWGYIRLPWAAIKSLSDYPLIMREPAVSMAPDRRVSSVQDAYLKRCVNQSPTPVVPELLVDVKWNVLVAARVQSGFHGGFDWGEMRDSLYICVFGFWVPVYNFGGFIT